MWGIKDLDLNKLSNLQLGPALEFLSACILNNQAMNLLFSSPKVIAVKPFAPLYCFVTALLQSLALNAMFGLSLVQSPSFIGHVLTNANDLYSDTQPWIGIREQFVNKRST